MKIDSTTSIQALLRERDKATRNRRDPYGRQRLAKIDRLLANAGYLVD